jgi:molecular chaperone Hsp33
LISYRYYLQLPVQVRVLEHHNQNESLTISCRFQESILCGFRDMMISGAIKTLLTMCATVCIVNVCQKQATAFVSQHNSFVPIQTDSMTAMTIRLLWRSNNHVKYSMQAPRHRRNALLCTPSLDNQEKHVIVPAVQSSLTPINKNDNVSIYRNEKNVRDQVFSAISGDGGIKVTACTIRNLVNELMLRHNLTPVPTQALGRTVCCGLLMANGIQAEQNVQISFRTEDGPLRGIVAVVTGTGEVRGYVGTPMLGQDWTLEDAVGKIGSVQIVKNHPSWPRPYNGITAVRYGDVDRDIGIYLAESEQRSCALAAACSIQDSILCSAAGGYLVEILPDCTTEEKETVEINLAKLVELDGSNKLPTGLLSQGKTPYDIASLILENLNMIPLGQLEPNAKCPCTEERLLRSLRLLPKVEIEEMLEQEGKVEARCEFCGTVYRMTAIEVREKMASAVGDPAIAVEGSDKTDGRRQDK